MEPKIYECWLHDEVFQPNIVVVGTEQAKTALKQKCGLTLAELFAPFGGYYRPIAASFQCLEKHVSLDNMRVRFVDTESAEQWTAQQAERIGAQIVEAQAPKNPHESQNLGPPWPWFEQWRLAMFRSLRWSDHEGLDQPIATVLVVDSKEQNHVALFEQLLHASNMPDLCRQHILDATPLRTKVVLHDLSDPNSPGEAELDTEFNKVRQAFSPHTCHVLRLHRGIATLPEVQDLYKPHIAQQAPPPPPPPPSDGTPPPAQPELCRGLNADDLDAISQLAAEIILRSAVPWAERRVQQLDAQIAQTRKGFRNQIKYLWRKPRETGAAPDPAKEARKEGSVYTLQTTEGQMRLAGDLAFLMRDYETALGYYRIAVNDFKQDKAWRHAAGAYEMSGVCSYITGAPRTEWERFMENAYDHYIKAGAGRHAVRAVMLQMAMVGDSRESALRLLKVSGDISDTGLHNALLIEQAAYLYGEGGYNRKRAFHLVLAGHTYNKAGFKRHALRCYSSVVKAYDSKQWVHITDHFHFTMARQAFGLGLLSVSMQHFVSLLNSFSSGQKRASVQAEREMTYLREFLYVVKNLKDKGAKDGEDWTTDLRIPTLSSHPTVFVREEDSAQSEADVKNMPSDSAVSSTPPAWQELGARLVDRLPNDDCQELQLRTRHDDARVFETLQRLTTPGAEVRVEFEVTNPMKAQLELVDAQLVGQLEERDASTAEPGADNAENFAPPCDSSLLAPPCPAPVEFHTQKIVLGPQEVQRISLVAVPHRTGLLRIQGLSWNLFSLVQCEPPLKVKGRRLRQTLDQRALPEGVYSVDRRLELRVCDTVPRVRVQVEGWPSEPLLLGEFCKCILLVTTSGEQGSQTPKTLRCTCSNPAFTAFAFGNIVDSSQDVLEISADQVPTNGEPLRIPFILRGDQIGEHRLRFVLLAEALVENRPKSECRQWVTLERRLAVMPSISCSVSQHASFKAAGKFILSCTVENQSDKCLDISKVRCISGGATLPCEECMESNEEKYQMGPGQRVHLLFRLARSLDGETQEAKGSLESCSSVSQEMKEALLKRSRRGTKELRPKGGSISAQGDQSRKGSQLDVVVEWGHPQGGVDRAGEIYLFHALPQQQDAPQCPLKLHISAPDRVQHMPRLVVDLTVAVQNDSTTSAVSFFLEARSGSAAAGANNADNESTRSAGFVWLGSEQTEIMQLGPSETRHIKLSAYFPSSGVFNLNRFRFHVTGLGKGNSAGATSVPTEASPVAYAFPFERLIHIYD